MSIVTSHEPGAFCWVELATNDQNATKRFYGELFGWTANDQDMGPEGVYTIFQLKENDAAAAYTLHPERQAGIPPHWMIYISTRDADTTVKQSVELGGEVILPAFDVYDLGRMAVLKDPAGAFHNIWQPGKNTGMGVNNEDGAFCWGQLNTSDTAKAEAYYTALFGWGAQTGTGGGMTYTEWQQNGTPIGGMMALPDSAMAPSHWLAYFSVANCDNSAAKAQSLGATIYVPPSDIPGTGRFSVLADPQGAVFALYQQS
ncbi:VOC family protein [Undibacterium sp. TS12]|uniref:VOC family protein n=1 Tax=Undibacterium sp. TS12 TaxID=2908202 RepID=UPI001F4D2515|nr:VOC family protein [Undibacterium sp. TS12]MCH8619273.1 VOC family protein [Undibacterium sp. TS12]